MKVLCMDCIKTWNLKCTEIGNCDFILERGHGTYMRSKLGSRCLALCITWRHVLTVTWLILDNSLFRRIKYCHIYTFRNVLFLKKYFLNQATFNNSISIEAVILEKIVKLSCITLNILRYDCHSVFFEDTSAGIWWIIFRKRCAVINKLKDSRCQCERISEITFSQLHMTCELKLHLFANITQVMICF